MEFEPLLHVGNAAAAILVDQAGRYLLQLRDDVPDNLVPWTLGRFRWQC
jgi:hypothetical protein